MRYWKDRDNVEKQFSIALATIGHFPSVSELTDNGYHSIVRAICDYHGGYMKFREAHGNIGKKLPNDYWKNWENVRVELENITASLDRVPTSKEMKPILISAIYKYHGGLRTVRNKLGQASNKMPVNYWKNLENIKNVINDFINETGHFPTSLELSEKHSSVVAAIAKYHGGLSKLKQNLGYDLERRPANYWNDFKNIENTIKEFEEKNNRLPTKTDLQEKGFGGIHSAIVRNHGGLLNVYKRMGLVVRTRKPQKYWKDLKNVESELKPIIENYISEKNRFPTYDELASANCSLSQAFRYHGGYPSVLRKMGYAPGKIKTESDFKKLIDSEETAKMILENFGRNYADLTDILAVIYGDRITVESLWNFLDNPSLRDYMGAFVKPSGGIGDLIDAGTHLLHLDKSDVIRGIIYRSAQRERRVKLGAVPSEEQKKNYSAELSNEMKKLDLIENPKPHEIAIKEILQKLLDSTKTLFELYENGIDGLAHRVKNPEYENGVMKNDAG
jgi:hypothetical protein